MIIGTQATPGWTYTNREKFASWFAGQGLPAVPVYELNNRPLPEAANAAQIAEAGPPDGLGFAISASHLDDSLALLRQPFWRQPIDLWRDPAALQPNPASWLFRLRLR